MKIFLLLQSSYVCRLTSKSSNDPYKVCSPILRYNYTILNTHYKLLLMKIFLLLQSSYFCRLTSKSSNDPYKVCSPILRYDYIILNTHYKLGGSFMILVPGIANGSAHDCCMTP